MRKEPRELTPAEAVELSLEHTENGKVANTMANYKRVLQSDPLLKGAICKNLLTGQVDVVKPLGWYRESSGDLWPGGGKEAAGRGHGGGQ